MTDDKVKDRCKILIEQINSSCVIGAGGPGMYLDGDGIFVLLYDAFRDIISKTQLEDIVDEAFIHNELEASELNVPATRGRKPGVKNKVVE